jgi:hypothetical protein
MPRVMLAARWVIPQVANMPFSSLIPHTFLNNWEVAIMSIVHITVMRRLFHKITAKDGIMAGILLAFGGTDSGKSYTLHLAECINGMHMVMGAESTYPGATARMKQLAGRCAATWDDFIAKMWVKQMGAIAGSTAGGADTVKMNNHGTYVSEAFTTLAISVRQPRPHAALLPSRDSTRPPRTTHSPFSFATTRRPEPSNCPGAWPLPPCTDPRPRAVGAKRRASRSRPCSRPAPGSPPAAGSPPPAV